MDICTLVAAVMLPSVCHVQPFTLPACVTSADRTKQLCRKVTCPPTPPTYACVRPDGSKYVWAGE
jgi:hypothetical protein